MRGRDEERQVVQPVAVDAPEERARHLARGRERDDGERLRACERRQRPQRGEEQEPAEPAEHELSAQSDVRVDGQQRRKVRGSDGGIPARNGHRRYWTSCQLGVGSSSSSARPPCGS